MAKVIICCGDSEDFLFGKGENAMKAWEDYMDNSGEDSFLNCKFFESQEIEIQFVNKIKEDEPETIIKD